MVLMNLRQTLNGDGRQTIEGHANKCRPVANSITHALPAERQLPSNGTVCRVTETLQTTANYWAGRIYAWVLNIPREPPISGVYFPPIHGLLS